MNRTALATVGVVVVVALGVGGWFLASAVQEPGWDERIEPYATFVEGTRELAFLEPVEMVAGDVSVVVGPERYSGLDIYEDREFGDSWSLTWELLGLQDPNAIPPERVSRDRHVAFDPATGMLMISDDSLDFADPALAFDVVHELTHALQHQHGIEVRSAELDKSFAQYALVEGDAVRIANLWLDSQPEAAQQAVLELSPVRDDGQPGDFLSGMASVPSFIGERTTQAIVDTSGSEELTQRQLGRTTTRNLTNPSQANFWPGPSPSMLADELAISGQLPDFVEWRLGSLVWFQVLAPRVGPADALAAANMIATDTFDVDFDEDARFCVFWGMEFERFFEANATAEIMEQAGMEDLVYEGFKHVQGAQCTSLGDPTISRPEVLGSLAWSIERTSALQRSGLDADQAMCAVIEEMRTIDWSTAVPPDPNEPSTSDAALEAC